MVRELNAFTRQNRLARTELLAWSSSNDLFATFLFSKHDKTPELQRFLKPTISGAPR
jgi:hypothetical protein